MDLLRQRPSGSPFSIAAKVAVDSSGNCYLAGWYKGTVTIGADVLQLQLGAAWNHLLAKFPPPTVKQVAVQSNLFGFDVVGAVNLFLLVEASPTLVNPVWSPLGTVTLLGGTAHFSDPQWVNFTSRFYRFRSP